MYKFLSEIPNKVTIKATLLNNQAPELRVYSGDNIIFTLNGSRDDAGMTPKEKGFVVYGMRDMLQYYMLQQKKSYMNIRVNLNAGYTHDLDFLSEITIIYCMQKVTDLTAEQFVSSYFLRSSQYVWLPKGVTEQLTYIPTGTSKVMYTRHDKFTAYDQEGEEYERVVQSYKFIPGDAISVTMPPVLPDGSSPSYEACIDSVLRLEGHAPFVVHSFNTIYPNAFRFRNIFNALEVIGLASMMTKSPKSNFQTADCEEGQIKYDLQNYNEYEVKTGILNSHQLVSFKQLCQSHSVEYWENGRWVPVIVTDYSVPKTWTLNSPVYASIKFRQAERVETIPVCN